MTEAETILRLIEGVDPNDTALLDEIDAHVRCYIQEYTFERLFPQPGDRKAIACFTAEDRKFYNIPRYTRSRDGLKQIRPDGWRFEAFNFLEANEFFMTDGDQYVRSKCLPTEELAELYAIIQAIAYDRSQP